MRSPLRLALKPHLKLNDHHHWFAGGCFFCTLVSILKFSSVQVASSAINTWHTWRRSLHSGAKTCLCHNTFPWTTLRKQTTGKKGMWSVLRLIMLGNLSEKHDRCTFCVPNDDTLLPLKILKDAPSPAQDTICLQLIFCEFTACFQTYFKLIGANSLLFKFVPTFNFKGHTESRL